MRANVFVLAGLVALAGYVRRRSDSDPAVNVAQPRSANVATREIVAPARVVLTPRPTIAEPLPPLPDLIHRDDEVPLPAAPPRTIHGRLVDIDGEPAVGATVVATGPSLVGEQVVLTDETGYFVISSLPIGDYNLTIYYSDDTYAREAVTVDASEPTAVEEVLDREDRTNKPTEVVATTRDYIREIPTGRTFGVVLAAVSGSQGDYDDTPFVGVATVDNTRVAEGEVLSVTTNHAAPTEPALDDPIADELDPNNSP